jgi:hypothetical protein
MPARVPLYTLVATAVWALVFLFAAPARADLQLDGRWRQGPLREEYTVQQWLPNGCGPTPQTGTSGGGEIVAIRLEGDELAFVGGGRVYRSNQCYDQMPTLTRETHSRDANGKTWRTRCTTPPNDPRKAILNTLVVAQNDTHIDIVETGRYEIVLGDGRCVADVKRTRAFDIVPDDKPVASAATPAPPPAPPPKPEPKPAVCESPGDPTRLEVRPSKKLLRTGETFQFRALVLDAKGCATKTPTTWKMQPNAPAGVTIDGKGLITIGPGVPEGNVEIIVSAAEKETRVVVEVTSPAHYDDLLAQSGLNASGENDAAAVVTIASSSIGAGEGRVEDRAKTRRWVFIGIVAGVLVVLGVLAAILRGRSRKAAAIMEEAKQRHEAEVADVLERRRQREEQHAAQRRAHEESVAAAAAAKAKAARDLAAKLAASSASSQAASAQPAGMPQPSAGTGTVAMSGAAPKRKICPTCGERFDAITDYCGKDGTHLVLLN